MKSTGLKAFLFVVAAAAVAGFIGYLSGALDPYLGRAPATAVQQPAETAQPSTETAQQPAPAAAPSADTPADTGTPAPAADAQTPKPSEAATAQTSAAPAAPAAAPAPTFDVLRVEGDGSTVVAGQAAPGSTVELVEGSTVLGKAAAGADGAFAIVLDDPLKPGDHLLALRATGQGDEAAASAQTAVVSVPEKPDGPVLAMVEEPGKAAQLLAVPQPTPPETQASQPAAIASSAQPEAGASAPAVAAAEQPAETVAAAPQPAETAAQPPAAAQGSTPAAEAKPAAAAPAPPMVAVEAVEIDGGKVFIAGRADAGRKVRVYANEILLGEATASPDGHFLVEASRDLPVGEYTIRADGLDAADSGKVAVRAAVPFHREPGEAIAAVAPPAPQQAAQTGGEQAAAPATPEPAAPATATPAQEAEVAAKPQPGEPQATVSPKLQHTDGSVIIRRGDTLWHISRRVYGHGIRYSTIYLANQEQIADPNRIWPGQLFKVPEKSDEGEAADFDAMGDRITVKPQQ